MPFTAYPVDGTVYDQNGSTAVNGATVIAFNATTQEKTSVTTNSSGEFIVDLANLASGWTASDKMQITVFYGNGSGLRSLTERFTLSSTSHSCGDMVLHAGPEPFGTCHITFVSATNSSAGGLYVDFYDRDNDVRVFRIEVAAGTSVALPIGYLGTRMNGGFVRVFESETSGELEVLTVVK